MTTAEPAPASELLGCSNGLLHLPTRKLIPLTSEFFNTYSVGYPYVPDAPEPTTWMNFLAALWPDDQQSIDTLQEIFGLLLTSDTSHQKMILMVGPPRSGKGTIGRVLTALLGKESVAGPTLASLTQNFGLMPLIGKPLAIISDARLSGRADSHVVTERLLAISGEDSIDIDRKYQKQWTGKLPTRFLILTNELPRLGDASGALASRFITLKLTLSFLGKEDHALTTKLLAERPGILRWSLDGYDRLRQRGYFIQPASGEQMRRDLEDLSSPIKAFIRDRCLVGPNHGVAVEALFDAWVAWCSEQNRDHPGTKQTFGKDLQAALPALIIIQPRGNDGKQRRYYNGISLDLTK